MYTLVESPPSVDDFIELRDKTGLSPRPHTHIKEGLEASLYAAHILDGDKTIAMARVVGDGYLNFDIVDVAVLPSYQGKGLGRQLMHALMAYLEKNAPQDSYITLMADVPALYEKFGFVLSSPETEGMYLPNKNR